MMKSIIFDIGGVITRKSDPCYKKAMGLILDVEDFGAAYEKYRLDYDTDRLDSDGYWTNILTDLNRLDRVDLIGPLAHLDMMSWLRINASTVEYIRKLHGKGYRLYILSNMPLHVVDYIERNFSVFKCFERRFYSCHCQQGKPSEGIFHWLLNEIGLDADDCLFIDDTRMNIDAAGQMGFHTVLFEDNEQFERDMARFVDV